MDCPLKRDQVKVSPVLEWVALVKAVKPHLFSKVEHHVHRRFSKVGNDVGPACQGRVFHPFPVNQDMGEPFILPDLSDEFQCPLLFHTKKGNG